MGPSKLQIVLATLAMAVSVAVAQGGYHSDVLNKVNILRQARGLPTLQYSQAMDAAAARHSYDQSGRRTMTHAGADGSRFFDRLRVAGGGNFKCSAENVAETGGNGSGGLVVDMWMNSQGHRDNMMRKEFTHMGVAQASNGGRLYWTMVLGGCN